MIKTIIFDIGNVLMAFDWKNYFQSFGFSEETLGKVIAATVKNPDWDQFDRGAKTDEEILEVFIENDSSVEKEIRQLYKNISNMLQTYDYAIPWIRELKEKGFKVLVLSNFSHKAYQDCSHKMGFLEETDGGILSFREKLIKPQPEIYKLLAERYQILPEESVFLDDTVKNLEAAKELGFQTIHFTGYAAAVEELGELCSKP